MPVLNLKALRVAFNQEEALVGAFSVITNLRMQFGCNFLKHYFLLLVLIVSHNNNFRHTSHLMWQQCISRAEDQLTITSNNVTN